MPERPRAERYIREEFDWIGSAISIVDREQYLQAECSGCSYAFDKGILTQAVQKALRLYTFWRTH